MKKVIFLTIVLFLGLASFSGQAALAGETTGEYIDDATITTQVKGIIANDMESRFFKIEVTTTKGEVVLKGSVNSNDTEARLVGKIKEVKGVKSVKSLLKVEKK